MLHFFFYCIFAIQTLLLVVYLIINGSSPENVFIFNLSISRLILISLIILVMFAFIIKALLGFRAMRRSKTDFLQHFPSQRSFWLLFAFFLLIDIICVFLLTRKSGFLGVYRYYFKHLLPIVVWLLALSTQSAIGVILTYCLLYSNHFDKAPIHAEPGSEIIRLFVVFYIMIIFLFVLVNTFSFGPVMRSDEGTYFKQASFYAEGYLSADVFHHYPPLYPIALSPAFVFKPYVFETILLINVVLAASSVFPLYLLLRLFIQSKRARFITVICCLVPFFLVIPPRITSENLYISLFLWTIYFTYNQPQKSSYRLPWDLLNSLFLASLYLTRYITLASIPFFFIIWWLKPFQGSLVLLKPGLRKIAHACLMIIFFIILFSPWLLAGAIKGVPLKLMMGFGVTANPVESQLTLENLFIWIIFYAAYFILVAAPVLPFLLLSISQLRVKKYYDGFNRWFFLVFAMVLAFFIACVRHSWRAEYNAELPQKIMGRYIIYFSVIFIISAFITLEKSVAPLIPFLKKKLIVHSVISFCISALAYIIIVRGWIIPSNFSDLRIMHASADAYLVSRLGLPFFLFLTLIYSCTSFTFFSGSKEKAFKVLAACLVLFYLSGGAFYYSDLSRYPIYPWLAKQIASLLPEEKAFQQESMVNIILPPNPPEYAKVEIERGLLVRGFQSRVFILEESTLTSDNLPNEGFFLRDLHDGITLVDKKQPLLHFYDYQFQIIPIKYPPSIP